MRDDLSQLSLDQLIDLWPGAIKGELSRRAERLKLTRSQYLRKHFSKPSTDLERKPRPKASKLHVKFAKNSTNLVKECEDWLREADRLPELNLLSAAEKRMLESVKKRKLFYTDLSGSESLLIDELRDFAQELRDQGKA